MSSQLLTEIKLAFRRLSRSPAWTTVAIVTLLLAISLGMASFSVVEAVLLRALPYPEADGLVVLQSQYLGEERRELGVSEPELYDYRERSRELEGLAPVLATEATLSRGDRALRARVSQVTNEIFEVLRVAVGSGRIFTTEELRPGGPRAVIVSHRLFTEYLGGDEEALGEAVLRLDEAPYIVVGAMPPGFALPGDSAGSESDVLVPLVLDPADPGHRGNPNLELFARLRAPDRLEAAEREKDRIVRELHTAYPDHYTDELDHDFLLVRLVDYVVGDVRLALILVLVGAGLVFAVALSTVVSLVITWIQARRGEWGVRLALGARFDQLLHQSVLEGMVLAILAGVPALLVGSVVLEILVRQEDVPIPRLDVELASTGLAAGVFLAAASALTVTVVSLLQLLRMRRLQTALREGSAGTTGTRSKTQVRNLLLVGQLALSVTLVIGTGLLLRSYRNSVNIDPGFDPQDVIVADVTLPAATYGRGAAASALYDRLHAEVASLPGVRSVGFVGHVPLAGTPEVWPWNLEGITRAEGEPPPGIETQVVAHDYFEALDIPLVAGEDRRTDGNGLYILINETMARQFWGERDPVGLRMTLLLAPEAPPLTISGVVRDVQQEDVRSPIRAQAFVDHRLIPKLVGGVAFRWLNLVVEAEDLVVPLKTPVAARLETLAIPNLVPEVRTMQSIVDETTKTLRFTLAILGLFAGVSVLVTLLGLYGLVSELVGQNLREYAIRQALGATRSKIVLSILGKGLGLVSIGLILGLLAALAFTRLLTHYLVGISRFDGPTFVVTGGLMLCCAAVACLLPARQVLTRGLATEIRGS